MYKFNIYFIDFLEIKQKNRIIKRKVYKYINTIHNINEANMTLKYIEAYNLYIKQHKVIAIHVLKENEKDYLLHNCYLYDNNGNYQKHFCKRELI